MPLISMRTFSPHDPGSGGKVIVEAYQQMGSDGIGDIVAMTGDTPSNIERAAKPESGKSR